MQYFSKIKKVLNQVLLDKDLQNTTLNQGFKLITGPLLILLLPLYISQEVQGYWFSFISISALSVLADLGFTVIILQFSAHEFAYLGISNNFIVSNDIRNNYHLIKLSTLLRFTIKWLIKLLIFAFTPILIVGLIFFNIDPTEINWKFPWILYTVGAMITFANTVILSYIEGCNFVAKTQRIRFYSTIINFTILFLFLALRTDLYALSISLLFSSVITSIIIYKKFHFLLYQLWEISKNESYDWFHDFFIFFKKYAISVASGYLVVQISTPLSFIYFGAVEAGKVGLTMSLCTAIFSISNIWFQSIAPKVNMLNSKKKWRHLSLLISKRLILSVYTYIFVFLIFSILYVLFKYSSLSEINNRFLPFTGILILVFHWLLQLPNYAMAFYLRAFKKEPFMILSFLSSICVVILTWFSILYLPTKYVFSGLLITTIVFLPLTVGMYFKKRNKWQYIASSNLQQ
ncbi:MAG: hypothetical protein Q8S23_04045 [Bacteroidales bacterium]|nr:hypothetical protein [Bacteroidales bacterium]